MDKKEDVDQRFYDDLEVEDTLGLVVKAHIHLEEEINNLLNLFLPCPKALADMETELENSQKVHLAAALGLDKDLVAPLKSLGRLRNDFAHDLKTELTEEREKSLYKTLAEKNKKGLQEGLMIMQKEWGNGKTFLWKKMKTPDKFLAIVVYLKSALIFQGRAFVNNQSKSA